MCKLQTPLQFFLEKILPIRVQEPFHGCILMPGDLRDKHVSPL